MEQLPTQNQTAPHLEGLSIRFTEQNDGKYLREWLLDPEVRTDFPMADTAEVEDAVARWIAFYRYRCSLTALMNGVPCGITTLYLQPYRRLAHQCEFGIIVGTGFRGKGIGSFLLSNLMKLAKEQFRIEVLHLQVQGENPAIRMYRRHGFREFGRQSHFIKSDEGYVARVFMERFLE